MKNYHCKLEKSVDLEEKAIKIFLEHIKVFLPHLSLKRETKKKIEEKFNQIIEEKQNLIDMIDQLTKTKEEKNNDSE